MAGRRGRTVSLPPQPPEPVAEPEPEKIDTDIDPEKSSVNEIDKKKVSASNVLEKLKCPEKIIERIIICPGGQNINQLGGQSRGPRPCPFHPPPDKPRQPWNTGLNSSPKTAPAPVIIYHQPTTCCCSSSSEDTDDEDDENDCLIDTSTFISFANMVFAAANVMSEHPDAYCNPPFN